MLTRIESAFPPVSDTKRCQAARCVRSGNVYPRFFEESGDSQHGRAHKPSAADVIERLVGPLERVLRHLDANGHLRRQCQELAPVGPLMIEALRASAKGARIISAGIHMSDIPSFPYAELWGERSLSSVANLTREDGHEFLELAPQVPVHTSVTEYSLEQANEALDDIRSGRLVGAAVLRIA